MRDDKLTNVRMNKLTNVRMCEWTNFPMDEWTKGIMDQRKGGRTHTGNAETVFICFIGHT